MAINKKKNVNKNQGVISIEIIGLTEDNIRKISNYKKEEDYFLNYRLDSYQKFMDLGDPSFGPKANIDYDKIIYYKQLDYFLFLIY